MKKFQGIRQFQGFEAQAQVSRPALGRSHIVDAPDVRYLERVGAAPVGPGQPVSFLELRVRSGEIPGIPEPDRLREGPLDGQFGLEGGRLGREPFRPGPFIGSLYILEGFMAAADKQQQIAQVMEYPGPGGLRGRGPREGGAQEGDGLGVGAPLGERLALGQDGRLPFDRGRSGDHPGFGKRSRRGDHQGRQEPGLSSPIEAGHVEPHGTT